MLPQGHVTNDNIGKDIQSRLHSSSTATDRGLGDKIMPTSNALQTTVVADDEALYRRGIFGLPLKGDACHARLVKEIEVFVWDEEFYSAIVIYLALGLYRDGIANGIESHGKGDDDKRDDHRTGSHKDWGTWPMMRRTFSLRSSMLSASLLLLSISQSHCWLL